MRNPPSSGGWTMARQAGNEGEPDAQLELGVTIGAKSGNEPLWETRVAQFK